MDSDQDRTVETFIMFNDFMSNTANGARPIAFSSMSSVFSFHILSLLLFGPLQAFEKCPAPGLQSASTVS